MGYKYLSLQKFISSDSLDVLQINLVVTKSEVEELIIVVIYGITLCVLQMVLFEACIKNANGVWCKCRCTKNGMIIAFFIFHY